MAARVLLLFPATSYRVDAFVDEAAALGVDLLLGSDLPLPRYPLEQVRVDFADVAASLAVIDALTFDGVVAVDERSAVVAAAVAADRGLPHHSTAGVDAARDKRKMRARLRAAGVAVPDHRIVAPGEPLGAMAFPCVVKPPMLSGSQGVIRADTPEQLQVAAARVRRILESHPSELRRSDGFFDLVIEAYVDGEEVAVDGFMAAGELEPIAVFDKPDALDGPFFEETIYLTPSRKSAAVQQRLLDATAQAARALGLEHGPVHAELRLAADGPVIIEIAARSIGGLCGRMLRHVSLPDHAANLEALLLCRATGRAPPPRRIETHASGVMMLPVPRSGVVRTVHGLEQARAVDGIDAVDISIRVGESVRALPEGANYLGFAFAHGPSPSDVERALRSAHAALRFDMSPLLTLA